MLNAYVLFSIDMMQLYAWWHKFTGFKADV